MNPSDSPKKDSIGNKALGIIGTLIGLAVGRYSGINLLLPLAATALLWWGGKKLLKGERLLFLPALSLQGGHLLWMAFGLFYAGQFNDLILDIVVLIAGLIWLVSKPSLGPVLLLGIFQALALIINASVFLSAELGSTEHKALLVHIIWRLLALFYMGQGYLQLRRKRNAENEPENS